MQTHTNPMPAPGTAAEQLARAEAKARLAATVEAKDRRAAEAQARLLHPSARKSPRPTGGTDLHARLVAHAEAQMRRTNPVVESVRRQVRDLVQAAVGPQPVTERNRQGMVQAYATRTNHLGHYQPFYTGTVSAKTIQHRRARAKMAKASRKANRRG